MQDSLDNADCCWICLENIGELVQPCRCPRKAHRPCLARWQLHCAGKLEEKKCRFCKESLPDWRQWLGTSSALQPQSRCRLPDTQDSSHSVLEGTARPSRPASLDTAAAAEPALSSATQGSVTESMTVSDSRSSEAAPLPVLPAPPPPPAFMRISYGGESYKIRVRSGAEGMAQFVLDCRKLLNIPPDQPFDVHFHCKEPTTGSDLRFHGIEAYDAAVHCASVAAPRPATQPPTPTSTSSSHSSGTRLTTRELAQMLRSSAQQNPESTTLQSPFATARASATAAAALPGVVPTGTATQSAAAAGFLPSRRSADRGTSGPVTDLGSRLLTDPNLALAGSRAAAVQRWVDTPSSPDAVTNRDSATAAMLAGSNGLHERNHRLQAHSGFAEQQAFGENTHSGGSMLPRNGGVNGPSNSLPSIGSSRSSNSLTSPHTSAEQGRNPRDSASSNGGYSTPPSPGDGCVWPWQSNRSSMERMDGGDGEREGLRGRGAARSMPLPAMHPPTQNGLMDRLVGMVKRYRTGGGGQ